MPPSPDMTQLLKRWRAGDSNSENELIALIYPELHAVAERQLSKFPGVRTLQTTEVVHEAFERLRGQNFGTLSDRAHFFAIAATVVRRLLVDYLRQKSAEKRGGGVLAVQLDDVLADEAEGAAPSTVDWLELDQALSELARIDVECVKIVEMRVFAGLTLDEIADILKVSVSTVSRQWRFARAWLARRLA